MQCSRQKRLKNDENYDILMLRNSTALMSRRRDMKIKYSYKEYKEYPEATAISKTREFAKTLDCKAASWLMMVSEIRKEASHEHTGH